MKSVDEGWFVRRGGAIDLEGLAQQTSRGPGSGGPASRSDLDWKGR
jgi:hypothetical protein